ncbi:hypothetical protein [Phreatobacter sp. AB_2022a]|uniref:hypothetical protein n=1 Tax=Phreatobacter sp. AB_2022a TaxID=3003134 RepID=UPI002286FD85|nr:hypothetical protein [Phreatobacter sp. AB_2022a]MCZ0738200.1 hypothetical protein [Phreatobacter sp. AB_2022a]
MNLMSKTLVLSAFAAAAATIALAMPPASRAAVSQAPVVGHGLSSADLDNAFAAFAVRPQRAEPAVAVSAAARGQVPMIQGDRAAATRRGACGQYTWPHIPRECQTTVDGAPLHGVRTVTVDTVAPAR